MSGVPDARRVYKSVKPRSECFVFNAGAQLDVAVACSSKDPTFFYLSKLSGLGGKPRVPGWGGHYPLLHCPVLSSE